MSKDTNKLRTLKEAYGYETVRAMLEYATFDSVAPAICTNENCSHTTDMEPDQDKGWCEVCETNTVKSCLILAGLI
jgi:hypothetical protein